MISVLLAAGNTAARCGRSVEQRIATVGARALHVAIPLYRSWWILRRCSARAQRSGMHWVVAVLGHRATVHVLFTMAALTIAAQTLHAREYGGFVGERPLLAAFMGGEADEVDGEDVVLGLALRPARSTFRIASVSRALEPVVLSAEATAPSPVLPVSGAALLQPVVTDTAAAETGRAGVATYRVEEGDVLSTIAERFGITTPTILWENKLSATSLIRPGDELRILPTDGITHTVVRGDTLESIAKRYDAEAEDILEYNNLVDADDLEIGDFLIIPGGRPPFVVAPPTIVRPRPVLRPALPLPSIAGKLLWPSTAGYRISQYFTWRHHGVDIAVTYGTPVFASDDGVVTYSGWMRGYGYQVTIDHGNGLKTRYAHNSRNIARSGQRVERGQTIAIVGSTGRSTGPHIHYEVFANGVRVNPFRFLR